MKKAFNIFNMILLVIILILDVCYISFGGLLLKGFTSLVFVIVGVINLIYCLKQKANAKFPIILLVGLVFAMAGDIVLNINFIFGAILFAIGHVFYFVAYCILIKFNLKDLFICAIVFVPSVLFIVLTPIFDFGGILMEMVCVVYALIISLMVGKAINNYIKQKNMLNLFIMIGAILFFFSDLMLLLNVFADLGKVVSILCLATYYPAQFMLAYSIFIFTEEKNKSIENIK